MEDRWSYSTSRINGMNEQDAGESGDVRKAVFELLEGRAKKACFISEVCALLQGPQVGPEQIERALSALEAEGAVIIREHFCADPHLEGIDLRIVAPIRKLESPNPELSAIQEIDKAWDQWLASYLANHRCG
jgi:hypothetical protein